MAVGGGTDEELRKRIAAIRWWHRIDLNGIETPGVDSKRHLEWIASHLPSSLFGLSVLDVGAWDGYFSFLAERRGAARVLAIDELQNLPAHSSGTAGFDLAKEVLRSQVQYRVMSASQLDGLTESFDVAFCLGVYYHARDPVDILSKIRQRLRPGGALYFEGLIVPGQKPLLRFFQSTEVEPTTFCGATLAGMEWMTRAAGFETVRLLGTIRGMGPIGRYFWWTGSRLREAARLVAYRLGRPSSFDRAIIEGRRATADPVGLTT
jgi:tRNA (mo5U34)-methyltransferase